MCPVCPEFQPADGVLFFFCRKFVTFFSVTVCGVFSPHAYDPVSARSGDPHIGLRPHPAPGLTFPSVRASTGISSGHAAVGSLWRPASAAAPGCPALAGHRALREPPRCGASRPLPNRDPHFHACHFYAAFGSGAAKHPFTQWGFQPAFPSWKPGSKISPHFSVSFP